MGQKAEASMTKVLFVVIIMIIAAVLIIALIYKFYIPLKETAVNMPKPGTPSAFF